MTQEAGLPENVVSLAEFRNKKIEIEEKKLQAEEETQLMYFDPTSLDDINEMCAETMNELFDYLDNEFGIDVHKENSNMVDLIMFLESYKSLILKAVEKNHPFQELAHKIFDGVKLQQVEDGYKYVFEITENT